MNTFATLSFISFLISLILGIYVLIKAPRKKINIIFFIFCVLASSLCFIEYELRTSESLERAIFWSKVQSIWPFSLAFTLHLIIELIGIKKRKKLIYGLIYVPAIVFFLIDLQTNLIKEDPIKVPWGWSLQLSHNLTTYLSASWITLVLVLSIYLPLKYYFKYTGVKKKQLFYIFTAFAINFVFVWITDVIPSLFHLRFPELSNTLGVIPFTIMAYAIWKYQLFEINPNSLIGQLMLTINDAVFLTNANQEIIEVNKAGLHLLGYQPHELIDKKIDDIVDQSSDQVFSKQNIANIITEKGAISDLEVNFCDKNHKVIPVSISLSITNLDPQENLGHIIVARDITARKQAAFKLENAFNELDELVKERTKNLTIANEKLLLSTEKAKESDRLKSAFLANMSHEIRTPMNGILGFTELLKEPNLSGELQETYIKIIEESGNRMLNIINDIVSISKIESGLVEVHLKELNINVQQEYLYTFFKPEAEAKNLKLAFKSFLPLNQAIVKTDQDKFISIYTNLIKNAIKYTDEGSIEFGYRKRDHYLEFYIKDTGIGIENERQEAVFERFIQADIEDKMARQGAGLGLSISKAYVEMLEGDLWLESEIGKGSVFYFTIPHKIVSDPLDDTIIEIYDSEIEKQMNGLTILIAEDDENSALLINLMLKNTNCKILQANNGHEAVFLCQNNPNIDLILMDIRMPEMDGYEATRQIRQFNKEVAIVAQTSHALAEDIELALQAGCNKHLSKPIIKKELLATIHYFCMQ